MSQEKFAAFKASALTSLREDSTRRYLLLGLGKVIGRLAAIEQKAEKAEVVPPEEVSPILTELLWYSVAIASRFDAMLPSFGEHAMATADNQMLMLVRAHHMLWAHATSGARIDDIWVQTNSIAKAAFGFASIYGMKPDVILRWGEADAAQD